MRDKVIIAENISKQYQLGVLNSGSLKRDLEGFWRNIFRKQSMQISNGELDQNSIWALKDIYFSISQGEVVGFVGHNGAGKSTLLKIISRIAAPTSGVIYGKGTIASLLEIGTGFHPELTGRENIYLNGNLLGMSKNQINDRLDAIIDFSGVEKFIDTPVKRYSSGMYVRLAFSVAAHIDPNILIIDEALSVGDTAFQQKCIAKMKDVASQKDKTILFVSHDMNSVQQLCTNAFWLENGKIKAEGKPADIVNQYLSFSKNAKLLKDFRNEDETPGNEFVKIQRVELKKMNAIGEASISVHTALQLSVEFIMMLQNKERIMVELLLFTYSGNTVLDLFSPIVEMENGLYDLKFSIPANFLNDGTYFISLEFFNKKAESLFKFQNCVFFDVVDDQDTTSEWYRKCWAAVRPNFPIQITRHT